MATSSSHEKLLVASKKDFLHYQSLPFAVYITAEDGIILEFNKEAGGLLCITTKDKKKANIKDFYRQEKERTRLINKLSGLPDGEWERNQTLGFKVKGKYVDLRYFARIYKDNTGAFLGSMCLVFQITAFERFRPLQDDMNIGMFELSEDRTISYANNKFKEIVGIKSDEELHNFEDLLSEQSEEHFSAMLRGLNADNLKKPALLDMEKADKGSFVGKVFMVADELDEEKNIIKIKGTLEDATFSDILDDVPIGLFSIMRTNNRPLFIEHCNNHFAQIFEKNIDTFIGLEFKRLVNNDTAFAELEYAIDKLTIGGLIKNYIIKCGVEYPMELMIQIKRLRGKNNSPRYAGAIYDVSDDVERRLTDWRQDFASFLHSYSAMSNSIRETMVSIIETHGTDVVKDSKTDVNLAFQKIKNHIHGFRTNYRIFLSIASTRGFNGSEISRHLEKLTELEHRDLSKLSLAGIRNIFLRIRKNIKSQPVAIAKEYSRPVDYEISGVLRYIKLLNLYNIEQEAYAMNLDIEEFKNVLRLGEYKIGDTLINLVDELHTAAHNLIEFAQRKNAEIKIRSFSEKVLIKCDQRLFYLAIHNVLMNAVKYSWTKPDEKKSRITIEVSNRDLFFVITVENRGVGIHKSEIASGKIFEFGHRGTQSSDRNRPGTGIGLWHTKKIVTMLNGTVDIVSDPLNYNSPDDFTKPFITKVTIKLPEIYE